MDPIADPRTLANLVGKNGAHPEYLAFQDLVGAPVSVRLPQDLDVWELIKDSIDSTGGFISGDYLIPHELELADSGGYDTKFYERQAVAKYDDFAKLICNGPWNSIVGLKDTIVRKADSPRLEAFWDDVDGNGTDMVDFLSYVVGQARRYGTGWIFLDRERTILNRKEDLERPPWAYCVPTRNVVWAEFDKIGGLAAVVYKKPDEIVEERDEEYPPLIIWTRGTWSRWTASGDAEEPYGATPAEWGPHTLGEVPAVLLIDEDAGPGRMFGASNMLGTALKARDVYNRDSEIREIERRIACPVLGLSVNDLGEADDLVIGTNRVLAYTGKNPPAWVESDLIAIDKLASERKAAKEAAFVSAEMAGIMGHTEGAELTSSGLRSQVELDKSERRIGRFGASTETAENKIARLFLNFVGEPDRKYQISYPRKFGLTDIDKVIERTEKRLGLKLGRDDQELVLKDYYAGLYPRLTSDEQEELAKKAAAAREAAIEAEQEQEVETARDRVRAFRQRGAAA